MKYYASHNKQLSLDLFRSSFEGLDKSNRWVSMGDLLPWPELEREYNSRLNNLEKGAGNKPARLILGAMLVKHKLCLSDIETIELIRENPYMQYLCGLTEFTDKPIFDPSLFVTIRKRISEEELNEMTTRLLLEQKRKQEEKRGESGTNDGNNSQESPSSVVQDSDDVEYTDSKGQLHKGVLKIDATCADAEVRYPVDVDLVHDGCKAIDGIISKVCASLGISVIKTCYKDARRFYLELVKRKKKGGKLVRSVMSAMLDYLHIDLRRITELLVNHDCRKEDCLQPHDVRLLTAIYEMYGQQRKMFEDKTHVCANRIVSIYQPHVRPIIRGKAKAKTEFGAKIGASLYEGYTFIDHHSWDAYNESSDLSLHINKFKERFGYLPATILADKIYMNKENRKLLKKLEIKTYCKPLGRPPKNPPSPEILAKMAKAVGERNEVECSFGTGKRIYRANNIRAKLPETARCWTGMCYFVKNVMKFLRELCHALIEIWHMLLVQVNCGGNVCYPMVLAKY